VKDRRNEWQPRTEQTDPIVDAGSSEQTHLYPHAHANLYANADPFVHTQPDCHSHFHSHFHTYFHIHFHTHLHALAAADGTASPSRLADGG
jgi:hypothetical protein